MEKERGAQSLRVCATVAAVGSLIGALAYLPELGAFFSSDDWVWIGWYGRLPAARFWEFLSPRVVWFYRPLQAFQFAALFQLFGFNPGPYNAALFLGHFAVCGLLFVLARELTGRARLAAAATVVFAFQWFYLDVLTWKSNLCTIQWGLVTLAACAAFARGIRSGSRGWRATAVALCGLDFLTKESAVTTPLLFGLIWLYLNPASPATARGRAARGAGFRRAVEALAPSAGVTGVYGVFHLLLVRNVYPGAFNEYRVVDPVRGAWQALFSLSHALLSGLVHPDLHQGAPWQFIPLPLLAVGAPVPALGLIAFAVYRRDRVLLLGLGWFFLTFIPTLFLENFHSARFYYLPAAGSALIVAELFLRAWDALGRRERERRRLGRLLLAGLALYWTGANAALVYTNVLRDVRDVSLARSAFLLLQSRRGTVPTSSVVVLERAPPTCFHNGIGAREMVQLALDDPSVTGVVSEVAARDGWLDHERRRRPVYVLDLLSPEPALRRLPDRDAPPGLRHGAK